MMRHLTAALALFLLAAAPDGSLSDRDVEAMLAAVDVYRGAQEGSMAVISDRTIGRGFLPTPGTQKARGAIPEALLDALKDRNVTRASLPGLCEGVSRCRVLTPDIQQRFRERAQRLRRRAIEDGETLPRGFSPFWDSFAKEFPDAGGLLRVSLPAFSDDGSQALVAIVWTAATVQGGSQLILMNQTGWGWEIDQVVTGNLAL
mgnify:CR=1 FL=1